MELIGLAIGLVAMVCGLFSTYKSIKRNLDKEDGDE